MPPVKKHPMQPIVLDDKGTPRFQGNAIIEWLFQCGHLDVHTIAMLVHEGKFDVADQRQLAQLLGYSVSGYADLSYADCGEVALADAEAAKLFARKSVAPPALDNLPPDGTTHDPKAKFCQCRECVRRTAKTHADADREAGRDWVCACGTCERIRTLLKQRVDRPCTAADGIHGIDKDPYAKEWRGPRRKGGP